jgi:hypothetical protein
MDRIYAQYGLKQIDLHRAVTHFKLDKDPDVESIKKTNSKIAHEMKDST